ncbi:MAG: hypothetical protein EXX96DRAFT_492185 [Benjaminiella poitrasii]|nr:MAG: hypothetical protein EXX96DRAFT_492185 [Benjaminiella poitrasii]
MEQREQQETNNGDNVIKKLFQTSSSSRNSNNNRPATSSLDSPDLFSTLLKYPPTQPQIVLSNNSNHSKTMDAVSISLARQSLEERSGYYRSPNRKPVPYYKHQHYHSAVFTSAVTGGSSNDEDEDTKMMKSWSDSSYKVW